MSHPELYQIGLNNERFSAFVFWESYLQAIVQGGVLTFVTFATLDGAAGNSFQYNYDTHEVEYRPTYSSVYLNGLFLFQAVVVIVNVKLMIATNTHSLLTVSLQLLSIALFYLAYFILNLPALGQSDLSGTLRMLLTMGTNWILLFFFTLSYCCLEYIFRIMYDNLHNVYEYEKKVEAEHAKARIAMFKANRQEKRSAYQHRGFDFDGEEGHDELVVGNLLNKIKSGIKEQVFH